MKIIRNQNIWEYHHRQLPDWVVVTTNTVTKRNGDAVMGAGIAKDAATRYPRLPAMYGRYLRGKGPSPTARSGVFPVYQEKLFLFPTKYDWRDKSSLELIQTNARQLVDHMDIIAGQDDSCTPHVFLPALGCGMGGLQWEYVEPVISGLLDDRFTVILND